MELSNGHIFIINAHTNYSSLILVSECPTLQFGDIPVTALFRGHNITRKPSYASLDQATVRGKWACLHYVLETQ
jgi:hypothetical protein